MIRYNNNTYTDYLDLMYFLIRNNNELDHKLFPHSSIYFIRYHLQEKFNRKFSLKEVKKLLAEELALGTITRLNEKH